MREEEAEAEEVARSASLIAASAVCAGVIAGCAIGGPDEIDVEVPPEAVAGRDVAAQSGCGACHRIGDNGNDGPGPELTDIGDRLPAEAIARSLEVGPGIMPSYADLPEQKKEDLVAFLAALRAD